MTDKKSVAILIYNQLFQKIMDFLQITKNISVIDLDNQGHTKGPDNLLTLKKNKQVGNHFGVIMI